MQKSKALINPSSDSSLALIQEALDQNRTLVIAGLCNVQYRGRATSTLQYSVLALRTPMATVTPLAPFQTKGRNGVTAPSGCTQGEY